MSKRAFLICPVRNATESFDPIVKELEADGWLLHYPPRDTNQDDPTGYRICQDNLKAIREADAIFVVWDGKSQGVLFDLGMAFALHKPISIVKLPVETDGKSFQNMIREWGRKFSK